jgi:DNA-binding transcriptional MerR regulator
MPTSYAKYNLIPEFERIKNPKKFYGLLSLRELSYASSIPESTLRIFYKRGWIHPIFISSGQDKSLWCPATRLVITNIQELKKNGFSSRRIRRLIEREFKKSEND